jgi:MarR family 2-MHQ and catechol resistance regulon transcriptional repressor
MVFADPEDVESNLVGVLDLLDQVMQALCRAERPTGVVVRRRETIDADLKASVHLCVLGAANEANKQTLALHHIEVNYIVVNTIGPWYDEGYDRVACMKKDAPTPVHTWLVLMKATQAITRYVLAELGESGLGVSDFAVLEVLLHKGPLPVNVIGPKVNLTPGSISVAVDRLVAKGLVSRVESSEDRRVRLVDLTARGKRVIAPIFQDHAATMEKVFAGLSSDELRQFEQHLKHIGRQAESLLDQRVAKRRSVRDRV